MTKFLQFIKIRRRTYMVYVAIAMPIFVMAQLQVVPGQDITFPFRALSSENALKNRNIPVGTMEPLKPEDIIQLNDGFLILSHISGQIFTFEGDTLISIDEVNQYVTDDTQTDYGPFSQFILDTLKLRLKFSTSLIQCDIYPSSLQVLYPFSMGTDIGIDDSICLWLRPEEILAQKRFQVNLKNIFDQPLGKYGIDTTMLQLPIPKDESRLIVLEFSDGSEAIESIGVKVLENPKFRIPTPCTATKSHELLELAIAFEKERDFQSALMLYQKAAEASKNEFYSQVNDYAKKRIGVPK